MNSKQRNALGRLNYHAGLGGLSAPRHVDLITRVLCRYTCLTMGYYTLGNTKQCLMYLAGLLLNRTFSVVLTTGYGSSIV